MKFREIPDMTFDKPNDWKKPVASSKLANGFGKKIIWISKPKDANSDEF